MELLYAIIRKKRPSLIDLTEALSVKLDTITPMSQMRMYPYEPPKTIQPYFNLESSFSIYLNETQNLLKIAIREPIDDYLLCLRFFCEAKKSDRSLSNNS